MGDVDADPAWSPDGKKIAFLSTRTGDGEIWIMNADGSNPRNLTNDPTRWDLEPEWSPDGKRVVYVSRKISRGPGGEEGSAEIFVIDVDGTNRAQLTHNDYTYAYPVFSPNGKVIVFHNEKGRVAIGKGWRPQQGETTIYANEIYVMDSSGNNVVQLTDTGDRVNRGVSWSRDGTKLVYTSSKGSGTSGIYVMDVGNLQNMDLKALKDKSAKELREMKELGCLAITQITPDSYGDTNPSFSPDGKRIVFQSIRRGGGGGPDLFVMDANGKNVVRLTNNRFVEKDPDWMR